MSDNEVKYRKREIFVVKREPNQMSPRMFSVIYICKISFRNIVVDIRKKNVLGSEAAY